MQYTQRLSFLPTSKYRVYKRTKWYLPTLLYRHRGHGHMNINVGDLSTGILYTTGMIRGLQSREILKNGDNFRSAI